MEEIPVTQPHDTHADVFRLLYVCRHLASDPRLPVYWQGYPYVTGGFVALCGDCSTEDELGLIGVCERCHFNK
jgi:hypothetical protein